MCINAQSGVFEILSNFFRSTPSHGIPANLFDLVLFTFFRKIASVGFSWLVAIFERKSLSKVERKIFGIPVSLRFYFILTPSGF